MSTLGPVEQNSMVKIGHGARERTSFALLASGWMQCGGREREWMTYSTGFH